MPFSNSTVVSQYVDNLTRQVPGVHALHQMAHVLLAEHVPSEGHVLVLGAGGGVELKAFAELGPAWRFTGVDPSAEMLALAVETLGPLISRVDLMQGYIDAAPDIAFDGATCLLTLHFLEKDERLQTLLALRRRLRPGAPLVVAHHSVLDAPDEKLAWFRRWASFVTVNGLAGASANERANSLATRLPTLSPDDEVALLKDAGFERVSLFYAALTFRGWVAYVRAD